MLATYPNHGAFSIKSDFVIFFLLLILLLLSHTKFLTSIAYKLVLGDSIDICDSIDGL